MSLIRDLVGRFGLSPRDFVRLIESAPARYKIYSIEKRSGGKRIIAQPSRELKLIQRFVVRRKLNMYPIHASAMGYVEGRNIRQNAQRHCQNGPILKLDFASFFPSILVGDWERFARANPVREIEQSDIKLYSKILFWSSQRRSVVPRCLSIGAPSSPLLSNLLLYDLDVVLTERAADLGVTYSRYADDITASGDAVDKLKRFETVARRAVKSLRRPKLKFNEEKHGLYLKGHRRMVTGLILTPTRAVSIGRQRKRRISAMLHRASLDQLDDEQRGQLKGLLGFCLAAEPAFVERMRRKYADEVIDSALKFKVPRRGH